MSAADGIALLGAILVIRHFLSDWSWHLLESLKDTTPAKRGGDPLLSWWIALSGAAILAVAGALYFFCFGTRLTGNIRTSGTLEPKTAVAFGIILLCYAVAIVVSGCYDDLPRLQRWRQQSN